MKSHRVIDSVPWHDCCFGCRQGADEGTCMRVFITEDGYAAGLCHTKEEHQGYPGIIHGGIIATYFDEVMYYASEIGQDSDRNMTIELNVHYLHPVPINEDICLYAWIQKSEGRHIYVKGRLVLPDGTVADEGEGQYLVLSEKSRNIVAQEQYEKSHTQESAPQFIDF